MKTAIIFAGGSGSRWAAAGYPKQLFKILGVPILHRTVRQLTERGVAVKILARDESLRVPGAEFVVPTWPRRWLSEDIAKTAPMWHGDMLGLFGDVCWTDEAMDALVNADGFHFIGRQGFSKITGGCPECFGWSWGEADNDRLIEGLDAGIAHAMNLDPTGTNYNWATGAIWQPYRFIIGVPIDNHCQVDDEIWIEHSDCTDDVDKPEAGARLAAVWERHFG